MIRNLEQLLKKLDEIAPVFATDIKRDEVEENQSFFIYKEKGEFSKSESPNQIKVRFYLVFVTKEGKELNEIEIIKMISKHALIFSHTEVDYGKIQGTDSDVKMTTFVFHHLEKYCYD